MESEKFMSTNSFDYQEPVSKLLTYGESDRSRVWPNYLSLGFTEKDIPELIKMLLDDKLNNSKSDSLEVWAPLHAWRTLGQLKAVTAIEPLLKQIYIDDDWVCDEIPRVLAMIGEESIPYIDKFLETEKEPFPKIHLLKGLELLGKMNPDTKSKCIEILEKYLNEYKTNDHTYNAFLILHLAHLNSHASYSLVKEVYKSKAVDESVIGNLQSIQSDFFCYNKDYRESLNEEYQNKYDYREPVSKLLYCGSPDEYADWTDYLKYGFTEKDISELIRMVKDKRFCAEVSYDIEIWAPNHALRVLGLLKALTTVDDLLHSISYFHEREDDVLLLDLPEVISMIGPDTLPIIKKYLESDYYLDNLELCSIECLENLSITYPHIRSECLNILIKILSEFKNHDARYNGFIISSLIKINGAEALPMIREAFNEA